MRFSSRIFPFTWSTKATINTLPSVSVCVYYQLSSFPNSNSPRLQSTLISYFHIYTMNQSLKRDRASKRDMELPNLDLKKNMSVL